MPANHNRMQSTAAIAGHPIHPLLVTFPIAFLIGAFGSDLAFWTTTDPFWVRASTWLLAAGIFMGILASVAGLIDFFTISRARSLAAGWVHFLGNAVAILLSIWNLWQRLGDDQGATIISSGIILSGLVVAIFMVTGWLGGELVFRHRIGMIADDSENQISAGTAYKTGRQQNNIGVLDAAALARGGHSKFTKND